MKPLDELELTVRQCCAAPIECSQINPEQVDETIARVNEQGLFEVVRSDPKTLLLDLDTPEAVTRYLKGLETMQQYMALREKAQWRSKSGNLHVLVELAEPLDVETRLFLQACLGSDGVKEYLSSLRLEAGVTEPSLLFKPKGAK